MTKKNGPKRGGKQTKGQKKEDIERKREQRAQRNAIKKERASTGYERGEDDDYVSFNKQLQVQGLRIKDVAGDGNCLFRALADQLNGDDKLHGKQRQEVVEYIKAHPDDFVPFLDETMSFERYLKNLASDGTYGGNDSIVAFARKNSVDVIIHQFNSPTFVINGVESQENDSKTKKIHLAYHNHEHYSSVRTVDDPDTGPAHNFHKENFGNTNNDNEADVPVVLEAPLLTKRQRKRLNKERDSKPQMPAVTKKQIDSACTSCVIGDVSEKSCIEDIEPIVLELQERTGFQDLETLKQYFVENSYDVDLTLSYLMHLMAVSDDDKNVADERSSIEANEEEILCECQTDEYGAIVKTRCDGASIEEEKSSDNTADDINRTCTNKDLSCECNNTENGLDMKKNKAMQTRRQNTNKSRQKAKQPTLSNRQRQELAKKAKKKRREETKKSELETKKVSDDVLNTQIKCINI